MSNPEIIAIAALGKETHFICEDDLLLWHNPEDLKRVKEITLGFPLIMGRKTFESIGRPLPHRTNIVLTRNQDYEAQGAEIANDMNQALDIAKKSSGGGEKVFIFGGSEIYNLFLDMTDKLMLTLYDSQKEGTEKFPIYEDMFIKHKSYGAGTFEGEQYEWVDFVRR